MGSRRRQRAAERLEPYALRDRLRSGKRKRAIIGKGVRLIPGPGETLSSMVAQRTSSVANGLHGLLTERDTQLTQLGVDDTRLMYGMGSITAVLPASGCIEICTGVVCAMQNNRAYEARGDAERIVCSHMHKCQVSCC